MAKDDHRDIANQHADAAYEAVEAAHKAADGGSNDLQRATALALLAIFHQLKAVEDTTLTLRGALDLAEALNGHSAALKSHADAMDKLERKLPDH